MFSFHLYTLFGIAKEVIAAQCRVHLDIEVPGLVDVEVTSIGRFIFVRCPAFLERIVIDKPCVVPFLSLAIARDGGFPSDNF